MEYKLDEVFRDFCFIFYKIRLLMSNLDKINENVSNILKLGLQKA